MFRPAWMCCLPALVLGVFAPVASAHVASGGASYDERPTVTKLQCVTGAPAACPQGELLRVRGEGLQAADDVIFLGRAGHSDDQRARPDKRSPHRVLVRVPVNAKTGPVRITSRVAGASRVSQQLSVTTAVAPATPPVLPAPAGEGVFPVRGTYDFGTAVNGFGGGRGHKGQDILSACGTPIVSARTGTVSWAKFQDRAGNYIVITADDGTSQAYMHMLAPANLTRGQRLVAGQPIGQVGQTGRASACHLHFELWTAPGWYRGGQAVDPLPELQRYATQG